VGSGWAIRQFGYFGVFDWGRLLCAHRDKGRGELKKIQTYVRK